MREEAAERHEHQEQEAEGEGVEAAMSGPARRLNNPHAVEEHVLRARVGNEPDRLWGWSAWRESRGRTATA